MVRFRNFSIKCMGGFSLLNDNIAFFKNKNIMLPNYKRMQIQGKLWSRKQLRSL